MVVKSECGKTIDILIPNKHTTTKESHSDTTAPADRPQADRAHSSPPHNNNNSVTQQHPQVDHQHQQTQHTTVLHTSTTVSHNSTSRFNTRNNTHCTQQPCTQLHQQAQQNKHQWLSIKHVVLNRNNATASPNI